MGNYKSITIKKAMNNIAQNKYLLPAIQRRFVWDLNQVEMLFDSILRDYPINTFMMWHIKDKKIRHNFRFYEFVKNYVQKFGENNPDAPNQVLEGPFYAIIDGQQRLTSLYIGLNGSYKVKKPNKWWAGSEQQTPMDKKELFRERTAPLQSKIDNEKMFNLKFLSKEEKEKEEKENTKCFWFKVGDALKFNDKTDVTTFLKERKLYSNKFARKTLLKLYKVLNVEEVINYYIVHNQNQDMILDVFIRTNSGGTALSFSDLLMSISSANWKEYDAREEIKDIRDIIYSYGNPHFNVSQDFILKSLLVLSDVDVRFKIDNFGKKNITLFESKWEKIKASLEATFHLLEELNFNDTILRAKNAVIPIAYYIYKNDLSKEIVKSSYDKTNKANISRWLCMSLLKGIFGGTSDSILKDTRDVIKKSNSKKFPIDELINKFKNDSVKNYYFDDDVIDSFIYSQYGSGTCGIVLNLLYSEVAFEHGNSVAQDHLHPKTIFESKKKLNSLGLSDEQIEFYRNKDYYNSCLNLQLLESIQNISKGDIPLKEWARKNKKKNSELYLSENTSLDIKEFEKFIEDRRKNIHNKLKKILTK